MSDNPYAPPASLSADPGADAAHGHAPARPWQVTAAVWLMAADWALAILGVGVHALAPDPPDGWGLPRHGSVAFFVISGIFLLPLMVLTGWTLHHVRLGRGWARMAYLLLVLSDLAWSGAGFMPAASALDHARGYLSWALKIAGVALLFLSSGRKWFRRASSGTPTSAP